MYNLKMYGVDQADAFLTRHLAKHKNRSWKKTAFFGVSKIALDNMSLLWNLLFPKPKKNQQMDLTDFLVQMALGLAPTPSSHSYTSNDHLYFKPMEGEYVGKKGRCIVCKESSCSFRCICNCWDMKNVILNINRSRKKICHIFPTPLKMIFFHF